MANSYGVTTPLLGIQPIAQTSSTAMHPLGTVVNAQDVLGASGSNYGAGTFIYLKGVTSTVVGSVVSYNAYAGTTTLVPNTANLGAPLAVAMAACTTGLYGWYQVGGTAVIKKTAVKVNPAVKLYISATAGRLMSTAASGKQVLELITSNAATVASATSTVLALIQWPVAQGATA